MSEPPTMFPAVTGARLQMKLLQVRSGKSAAVLFTAFQNDSGAPALMNNPIGMKYTFATQCSNPAAANAATGGTAVTTRSTFVLALKHIQTARHTSALHMMPSVKADRKGNEAFAVAVFKATRPTAPPPKVYCMVKYIKPAVNMAPMEFPAKTRTQLNRRARVVTLPLAQAITTRLLPVKSSAPAMITASMPTQNANPMSSLPIP